jgi:adenylate kinase
MRTLKQVKEKLKSIAVKIRAMKDTRKDVAFGYVDGLQDLQREYRYLHVAYCMVQGVPYELIETTTREDNKIYMPTVERLMGAIEMPVRAMELADERNAENVCHSAE